MENNTETKQVVDYNFVLRMKEMLWSSDESLANLALTVLEESLSFAHYRFLRGFSKDGTSFFPPYYMRRVKTLGRNLYDKCSTYEQRTAKITEIEGYKEYKISKQVSKTKNKVYAQKK